MIVLHPLLKLFFNTGEHWFAKTNTKYPIFSAYGVQTGRVGIPRISMCGRVGILGGEHHIPVELHKAMSSRNVVLVSAGYDGVIRFWDISGGHTKRTLKYEDNPELKVKMVCTDRAS